MVVVVDGSASFFYNHTHTALMDSVVFARLPFGIALLFSQNRKGLSAADQTCQADS